MASQQYEIHIKGHLNHNWSDWLDCMQMCCLDNGETILSGMLADQAALMGILNKLYSMNLTILSVSETGPKDTEQPNHHNSMKSQNVE